MGLMVQVVGQPLPVKMVKKKSKMSKWFVLSAVIG